MTIPMNSNVSAQTSPIKTSTKETEPSPILKSVIEPVHKVEAKAAPTKSTQSAHPPTIFQPSLRPVMAQYGAGNNHPIVSENYLKTFNVRAPATEVLCSLT